ncbi:MAG TPA: DEAD/DEAH box helicase family protein [Pyrinomonadaceae bacterium]|nr:DEAD/DEAH box helicase family protein [Pyrinomonadaceae bacterium]
MENPEVGNFFTNTSVNILGNLQLREPQRDAYQAIFQHFEEDDDACYVQLPVGCGKSGLMGLTPFGVTTGRVLIVAPNLTIRKTVYDELDVSNPDCFFSKRGVLSTQDGPFISALKTGANIHDCDNAHFVIANIQQFAGSNNKWYEQLPRDYFQMILVDEGHHNVAETWRKLFDYFNDARIISFTATPLRSDGKRVSGKKVYSYSYVRSMMMGFISPIDVVYVAPRTISFTAQGSTKTLTLKEVLEMRDKDWFSKGIALSEECNRHIVQASIRQLNEVKKHGTPRQIIAAACSIRHATQVAALYHEHGLKAEVLHSDLTQEERDRIEAALRSGLTDAVVQVQILGEGYDLGTLSVAAVFRPYRSLSPYIQFVGRILRLANPQASASAANRVYLVSHVGLNDERWWIDFTNFDRDDQTFFAEYLAGSESEIEEEGSPRLTLRPFMRVLEETVEKYVQKAYLKDIDETMVDEFLNTIRSKGFEPSEFGLTEEMVRARLQISTSAQRELIPFSPPVQPQRKKEALRTRVYQEARSIADVVINRLGLKHPGRNLIKCYPGRGPSNAAILITLAQGVQNNRMGISAGERDNASLEQLQTALDASADIADQLTSMVRNAMEAKNGKSKVAD